MTRVNVTRRSSVQRSGRLSLAAATMDHPDTGDTTTSIDVDVPLDAQPWTVGLVVGPSGSGKTTVAGELWSEQLAAPVEPWPQDRAIVDAFPEGMTASQVTECFTRVGLSSVPAWIRPFHCLSNGEQFRATMARALAGADPAMPVVVDEFTSVVDRQVAQVVSHTVQKWCRKTGQRFVGVSCHYDILDWLQPDWVLDMSTRVFTWRSVQPRPRISLDVHEVPVAAWTLFKQHHYLSGAIHKGAKCFCAFDGDTPVAFICYLHFPHPHAKNIKMGHRTVVLPDWQGLGIAGRLKEWLGDRLAEQGFRYRSAVVHPVMKHLLASSPRWRLVSRNMGFGGNVSHISRQRHRTIQQQGRWSFEYQPRARNA